VGAGADRAATFLNLPPGRHLFEVTTTDAAGQWSGVSQSLEFDIPAAWWQSAWFRAAALLAVLALAAVAVRIVVMHRVRRRLRLLEQQLTLDRERARIAKDMHDSLGANLTRIALLSERSREDASAPAMIARAAREASRALDEIVWAMNPGNDTLERLLGYLSEYAAEFLAPTPITLQQDLPATVADAPVPSRARHGLFLAFKEALNNAVKHAAATQITLRVAVEPGRLRVTLADDGRGFDPAAPHATGEGLASIRQRLAAGGGQCEIRSAPGQGTQIVFTLPIEANRG
jgi:signal transduction histidine kinase